MAHQHTNDFFPVADTNHSQNAWHEQLLLSGANVHSRFVQDAGVAPIAETSLLSLGERLLKNLNPSARGNSAEMLAELSARETYLACTRKGSNTQDYVSRIVNLEGHRSVARGASITHLVTGISVPCAIELIRRGGEIARLTTSRTKVMDQPFYRIFGSPEEQRWQVEAISKFISLRDTFSAELNDSSQDRRELFNLCDLQSKTIPLLHTMNLTQLHSLLKDAPIAQETNLELYELLRCYTDSLCESYPSLFFSRSNYGFTKEETDTNSSVFDIKFPKPTFIEAPEVDLKHPRRDVIEILTSEEHQDLRCRFQIRGVSLETVLEFAAHENVKYQKSSEGSMYRIQGSSEQKVWQSSFIERFCELRSQVAKDLAGTEMSEIGQYAFNTYDLGNSAYTFEFSRSLSGFHNLFVGRLAPHGNELEVQEVCQVMCQILHENFPEYIHPHEYYRQVGNEAKF